MELPWLHTSTTREKLKQDALPMAEHKFEPCYQKRVREVRIGGYFLTELGTDAMKVTSPK